MMRTAFPLAVLLAASLFLTACSTEAPSNGPKEEKETKKKGDADPAKPAKPDEKTTAKPAKFTHVVTLDAAYYLTGPQQASPPDGTLEAGTKINLVREAGSYCVVESECGIKAHIATGSFKPIDAADER